MIPLPQPLDPDGKGPRPRDSQRRRDLAPFVAILAIGAVLVLALGDATAVALTTTCAALFALYAAWRRHHPSPPDDPSETDDEFPR